MISWQVAGRVSAVLMALTVFTVTAMDEEERSAAIDALGVRAAGYVDGQTEREIASENAYVKRGIYRRWLVLELAYAGRLDDAAAIAAASETEEMRKDYEAVVLRAAMGLNQPDYAIGERRATDVPFTVAEIVDKASLESPWREAQPYLDLIAKVPEGEERERAKRTFITGMIMNGSYELVASLAQALPASERADHYATYYELYSRNNDYQRFVDLEATVEAPSMAFLTALSRAYVKLGKPADAVRTIDLAAGQLEAIAAAKPATEFVTLIAFVQQAGELQHMPANLQAAVARAIAVYETIPAEDKRFHFPNLLGQMYGVQGRFDEAWELYETTALSAKYAQFAHAIALGSKLGKRKEAESWVIGNAAANDARYLAASAVIFRYYRDDVDEYSRRVATMQPAARRLLAAYVELKDDESRRDIAWDLVPFFEATGAMVNRTGNQIQPAVNPKVWGLDLLKQLKLNLHKDDGYVLDSLAQSFAVSCVLSNGPDGAVAAAQVAAAGKEPKAALQIYRRLLATVADGPTEQAVLWTINYCGDMDMAMDLLQEFCFILAQTGKLAAAHAIAGKVPQDRPDANIRTYRNGLSLAEAFARYGDVEKTQAVLTAIAPKGMTIPNDQRDTVAVKVKNTFTALGYHGVPLATVTACIDVMPTDDLKAFATIGALAGYGNCRPTAWYSRY